MDFREDDTDLKERFEELKKYDFDFENLAFEGGGAKMAAYVGAIEVVEHLGILQQCKRFAGTSGGSIIAAFLAIELNAKQIKELMSLQFQDLINDSKFGAISMLPNMMRKFGWNPATKFHDKISSVMRENTGDANITFHQVYKKYKKTLCIVATNVSTMSVEYFHPKTTPNTPLVVAIRASVALPGWYLSMKSEDSFFEKLGQDEEEPFGTLNPKSVGFMLYTAWEGDFMQGVLHGRYNNFELKRPDTALAKSRKEKCDTILEAQKQSQAMMQAAKRFLQALRQVDVDHNSEISVSEFKAAFDKVEIKPEDIELLFGKDFNVEKTFQEIDTETDGQITFEEFLLYMQTKGIRFRALLEGGNMMQINSFGQFFEVTFNTILNMTRKVHFKKEDNLRTVGIYTDYIDTTDFVLTDEDKEFARRQGIIASIAYFQEMIDKKKRGLLPDVMADCMTETNDIDSVDVGAMQIGDTETQSVAVNNDDEETKA